MIDPLEEFWSLIGTNAPKTPWRLANCLNGHQYESYLNPDEWSIDGHLCSNCKREKLDAIREDQRKNLGLK